MSLWAQRRAAVAAEERAEAEALEAAARAQAEQALEERSDEDLLAEAGVKAPEDLMSSEEVRDFLKHALPERLRRRALRQLWGMNPILANVDGLVDYGEDFTDAATVVANMQTVYTVGKGMLEQFKTVEDEVEALVAEVSEAADAEAGEALVAAEEVEEAAVAPEETLEEIPGQARDEVSVAAAAEPFDPAAPATGTRRMRFSFET